MRRVAVHAARGMPGVWDIPLSLDGRMRIAHYERAGSHALECPLCYHAMLLSAARTDERGEEWECHTCTLVWQTGVPRRMGTP